MEKYSEIARSEEFHKLETIKDAVYLAGCDPVSSLLFVFTAYGGICQVADGILCVWVYHFWLFIWGAFLLCCLGLAFWYVRKARQFDRRSETLLNHYNEKKGA